VTKSNKKFQNIHVIKILNNYYSISLQFSLAIEGYMLYQINQTA